MRECAQTFSEVYGLRKGEIREELGTEKVRQLTVTYLTNFPKTLHIPGLRKLKSKAMVEAMKTGTYENGNHKIEYKRDKYLFIYYYRGTMIYAWDAYNDVSMELDAGQYEHTASTRNQRKEIQKSIENFKEAVLKL